MKSLIIGGAGFVGAYLIRHLRDDLKHEVIVTKMPQEQITEKTARVYDLNILQKEDIIQLFEKEKPDYIFHLIASFIYHCLCFFSHILFSYNENLADLA